MSSTGFVDTLEDVDLLGAVYDDFVSIVPNSYILENEGYTAAFERLRDVIGVVIDIARDGPTNEDYRDSENSFYRDLYTLVGKPGRGQPFTSTARIIGTLVGTLQALNDNAPYIEDYNEAVSLLRRAFSPDSFEMETVNHPGLHAMWVISKFTHGEVDETLDTLGSIILFTNQLNSLRSRGTINWARRFAGRVIAHEQAFRLLNFITISNRPVFNFNFRPLLSFARSRVHTIRIHKGYLRERPQQEILLHHLMPAAQE